MLLPATITRRVPLVVALALLLTACGIGRPTPARFHPPLPPSQPLPGLAVEDVVAQLQRQGYGCFFDLGGDISSGWSCLRGDQEAGDWASVNMKSAMTGPIEDFTASRTMQVGPDTGPGADALDDAGTALFDESVLDLVIPEEHRPTYDELHEGVQRNFPMELGGGWILGFDRNAISRTLHVVFAPDESR